MLYKTRETKIQEIFGLENDHSCLFLLIPLVVAAELHMSMMRVVRSNERCSSKEISSFFKSLRLVSKVGRSGGNQKLFTFSLVCSLASYYYYQYY